jgi:hypothetical protein
VNHNRKKTPSISLCLLLSVMQYTMASTSNGGTKTYCKPFDLSKYNPTPTEVADPSLEMLEDKLASGIIKGNSVDTQTVELNDSPFNTFTLTVEAATRLAQQKVLRAKRIMDTESVIGVSVISQPIVYTLSDIMTTIFNGLLPINSASTDGSVTFPGNASSTDNHSASIQNSVNDSYTTNLVGQLNYNDIVTNYLGGKSPATSQYNNGSQAISQLLINTMNLYMVLNGCNATFPSSSDSDDSSTSTSNSDISSTQDSATSAQDNDPSGSSSGSSSSITDSLQSCSSPIAACELFYIQNTLAPAIQTYLNGFNSDTTNGVLSTSELKNLYNDTLTNLNNILNEDLTNYGTTVGMSFPTNCLQATCSGSDCPADSDVQAEIGIMSGYLKPLIPQLKQMQAIYVNSLILEAIENKQTTEGNYENDKYFYNPGYTLGEILSSDSFGTPSTVSPMHCSTKSSYQQASMKAIANDQIDKLSSTISIPEYLPPSDMPFDTNMIGVAGGFSSVLNQNIINNYATNIPAVLNARGVASHELTVLSKMYNAVLKSFSAQKSLALQNLRMLVNKRSELVTVPLFYNPMKLKDQCSQGINNSTTSNDCLFQEPFTNINTGWNLTNGQQCSLAELERIEAQWRQEPFTSTDGTQILSPWMQQTQYMTGVQVARAENLLLAEIREQIYNNNMLRERINATKAAGYLSYINTKKKAMMQILKTIEQSTKDYITGS